MVLGTLKSSVVAESDHSLRRLASILILDTGMDFWFWKETHPADWALAFHLAHRSITTLFFTDALSWKSARKALFIERRAAHINIRFCDPCYTSTV